MPAPTSGTLIGPAGVFNGLNQYLTRADAAGLGGQTAVTWFGFCQATAANVLDGIFGQGPLDGVVANHGLAIWWAKTGARGGAANCAIASIRTASGYMRLESSAALQSTTAMSLCLTYASGQLPKLYKDGAVDTPSWVGSVVGATATKDGTLTGAIVAGSGGTHIGTALNTTAELWAGTLDEIWLRAGVLTPEHIAAQHQAYADPEAFLGYGSTDTPENANLSVVAVPDVVTATKNVNTDIPVLDNDYEPGGGAKTLVSVGTPTAGTATKSGSNLRYNSGATFTGFARCTYVVSEPGGKQSTGVARIEVVEPASTSDYDIDLSKSPWKDMDNVNVSGTFADVLAAAKAGPNGRFYTWTGSTDTSYSQGTTFAWNSGVAGTAAKPKIIRVAGNPASHKIRNAQISLTTAYCGIWGVYLSGRANGSMILLGAQGTRAERCRITEWGHETSGTIPEASHAIAVNGSGHDSRIIRCEIDTPLAWTSAEVTRAGQLTRGLLKMGVRVAGNRLSESALRVICANTHFHDFIGRPGGDQGDYNKGQNDCFEGQYTDLFEPGESVASIMDTCLVEGNPETGGVVDMKGPGWTVRRLTMRDCVGGNLAFRGRAGNCVADSCYFYADTGGISAIGPDNILKGCVAQFISNTSNCDFQLLSGHSDSEIAEKPGSTRRPATNTKIYGGTGRLKIGYWLNTKTPFVADTPATGTVIYKHKPDPLDTTKGYTTQQPYTWSNQGATGTYFESGTDKKDDTVASPVAYTNAVPVTASEVGIDS